MPVRCRYVSYLRERAGQAPECRLLHDRESLCKPTIYRIDVDDGGRILLQIQLLIRDYKLE